MHWCIHEVVIEFINVVWTFRRFVTVLADAGSICLSLIYVALVLYLTETAFSTKL